jgi:hypothetical protein
MKNTKLTNKKIEHLSSWIFVFFVVKGNAQFEPADPTIHT